ncbi:MAG: ATP-binding protein [Eubacteriales bacterium]
MFPEEIAFDRANDIIMEYLSLGKNRAVNEKVQNLNIIVGAVSQLISANALSSGKYVTVELGDVPDLLLDDKEIRQLTLNLANNGLESMSHGGRLIIKTFTEGDEVVLSFKDQGGGIDQEVLDKIGTPFFTTKTTGTGLGLAVCYSIAARHYAVINIDTGSNGTTVYVRFGKNRVAV